MANEYCELKKEFCEATFAVCGFDGLPVMLCGKVDSRKHTSKIKKMTKCPKKP